MGDKRTETRAVTIFDTTLRDGEQTPGVSFTLDQKIAIAHQLADIGVHVIEAGFPASSVDEKGTVRSIASEQTGAKICGLARSIRSDVDTAIDCGVDMVHVFIPTSEVQRTHTIKKSHEEVLAITADIVGYTREHIGEVMFSAMDATRTAPGDLIEVYRAAVDAGATIINVPDTVGIATPTSMHDLVRFIRKNVDCPIDIHCHNDFGMAVANTVTAAEAGASQVQVTVNGIGERAGNADLAQTVMSLTSIFGMQTGIVTERLVETSRMVSRFSGIGIAPTQPVVGDNAFSHESGIHSQGVLSEASTFEPGIMTPEMVGHRRRLKLGKHVGRHAVSQMLSEAHINTSPEQLHVLATATVKATVDGSERICCRTGNGPVDAAMNALLGIVPSGMQLKEYSVSAISGGSDAIGHVTIAVEDEKGRIYDASASSDNIVLASVDAMINALNLVYRTR